LKNNLKTMKPNKKIELVNITPHRYMCTAWLVCPAVYSIEKEGKLAIVGKKGEARELGIAHKVGEDEVVAIVDREMIRQIFEK